MRGCFPGLDAKGSDLPPRRECAEIRCARMLQPAASPRHRAQALREASPTRQRRMWRAIARGLSGGSHEIVYGTRRPASPRRNSGPDGPRVSEAASAECALLSGVGRAPCTDFAPPLRR